MNAKSHIDLNAREKSEASSTNIVRNAVSFKSGGEILHGWLYLPSKILPGKRLPAIAAANAMTAVKEINLPEYAERFAKAGFATIIIGGFGISLGGEHMLFLATWEPRLKAVVAVSTGISPQ